MWFDRTVPMKRRRRSSGWLGVLGALAGYGYATAAGASALPWTLGGALAGAMTLVVAFVALKLVLATLILGGLLLIIYLIFSALER